LLRALLVRRVGCIGKPAFDEIDCYAATITVAQRAENAVPVENGGFPLPQRNSNDLEALDELLCGLQQVQVEVIESVEELELLRPTEDDRRNRFLDYARAGAILRLVDLRTALALGPHERAHHRRPPEMHGVREVEDVVKAVPVRVLNVVREAVAEV